MRTLFFLLFLCNFSIFAADWGPKIKISTTNDVGQQGDCYIGVDVLASDGWDEGVIFNFDGQELKEYDCLPPMAPPGTIYCVIVRDSTLPYDSYTYTDFRGIPETKQFMHKYRLEVMWGPYSQKINIKWGKLPDGIDSAKFRCYEWFDATPDVDMRQVEEITIDNEALHRFDFTIYYNKDHSGIIEKSLDFIDIYPNVVEDYFYIDNLQFQSCEILNTCGSSVLHLENLTENQINTKNLVSGLYFIKLIDNYGKIHFSKIIKR